MIKASCSLFRCRQPSSKMIFLVVTKLQLKLTSVQRFSIVSLLLPPDNLRFHHDSILCHLIFLQVASFLPTSPQDASLNIHERINPPPRPNQQFHLYKYQTNIFTPFLFSTSCKSQHQHCPHFCLSLSPNIIPFRSYIIRIIILFMPKYTS